MNREHPTCARCQGTRFLHVRKVMDYLHSLGTRWLPRPVGIVPGPPLPRSILGVNLQAVGHFETYLCRACGLTEWFAFDWDALPKGGNPPSPCAACKQVTRHVRCDAAENTGGGFDIPRLTRGALGWDGFLQHDLCSGCGYARWYARDYHHIDNSILSPRHEVGPHIRRCLSCESNDAIVVLTAQEYEIDAVPVAVKEKKLLGFIGLTMRQGSFSLRVCRPCGALEWYAVEPKTLEADPAAGVLALGEEPQQAMPAGPYR